MSGHDEYACELLRRADLAEIARLRAEVETLREERDRYDSAQMRGWDLVREVTSILFGVPHHVAKYEMDPAAVLPEKARAVVAEVERLREVAAAAQNEVEHGAGDCTSLVGRAPTCASADVPFGEWCTWCRLRAALDALPGG